jgi:3-phosphoshikimate 1-carboxyvinyltransferase
MAPAGSFRGTFRLPGDKSISHRLAIFSAVAEGETRLENYMTGADGMSTLHCLEQLGVDIAQAGPHITIRGHGWESLRAPEEPLDAGNSGTALRLLPGILAGRPFRAVLTGDDSLLQRPVERIAAPLRAMGARVETTQGRAPLAIHGGTLQCITWDSPVASAQVKTAVLLAGLQAHGVTTAREPHLSRDHTERWLPAFGVPVDVQPGEAGVTGPAKLSGIGPVVIPGDPSSAAFLVVAALILPGSEVVIEHVLLNPERIAFLNVLRRMGANIEVNATTDGPEAVGQIIARSSRLGGAEIGPDEVPGVIDEIPILAVAAANSEGTLDVTGAAELRVKESDRIAALTQGLGRMGVQVDSRPDGIRITGGARPKGARVEAFGDHRIAMSLAVAALGAQGDTEIAGAACAAVSFPEFFALLERGAH